MTNLPQIVSPTATLNQNSSMVGSRRSGQNNVLIQSNEQSLEQNSPKISLDNGKRKLSLKERPDNQNITGDSITHMLEKR